MYQARFSQENALIISQSVKYSSKVRFYRLIKCTSRACEFDTVWEECFTNLLSSDGLGWGQLESNILKDSPDDELQCSETRFFLGPRLSSPFSQDFQLSLRDDELLASFYAFIRRICTNMSSSSLLAFMIQRFERTLRPENLEFPRLLYTGNCV